MVNDRPGENPTSQSFEYVVGGSLPLDAVSYVKRSADDEIFEGLRAGEFCYVLNSRQMGKSSLRVRSVARLQAVGVVCVSIDITEIGSTEVTAEQFYFGVLWTIFEQIQTQAEGLRSWDFDSLEKWWAERSALSVVQRWVECMQSVVLERVSLPIAIFIDEIDSTLALTFNVDDFFAAIWACYNRRGDYPEFNRLTFALLGVCAPQDLIQDKRRTPFNIGQAIELNGFTEEEAIGLAKGLPGGVEMLREVLGWTGGQPFLTQRVCRLVVEMKPPNPQFWGDMSVDEVVQDRIIRVWESNDEQVHFQTIANRIMADESIAGALLGLYQRVLAEGGVGIDGSAEQVALRLTGLVVKGGDRICVANRIYEGVFGIEWVSGKLEALRPYGEELRKWLDSGDEALLLRGNDLRKATVWADEKPRKLAPEDYRFLRASQELEQELERSVAQEEIAARDRENQILQVENQEAKGQLAIAEEAAAKELMKLTQNKSGWPNVFEVIVNVVSIAFAGTGLVYSLSQKMWIKEQSQEDSAGANISITIPNSSQPPWGMSWNSNGTILATSDPSGSVKLWTTLGRLKTLSRPDNVISTFSWSPNGQMLATGGWNGEIKLLTRIGENSKTFKAHQGRVSSISWSPNGQILATCGDDNSVKLWTPTGGLFKTLNTSQQSVTSLSWNPDGKVLVTGGKDSNVTLWRSTGEMVKNLEAQ